jgi:methionyl-tRNA formyltransferase
MRVVFLGNAKWSVPSLEAIAGSSHDLSLVLTRTPRLGGRGNKPLPTAVSEAARRLDLPLREVDTVKSGPGFDAIAEAEPDVLAVVAYGEIVSKTVLALPSIAPVNVHFSLLPQLRGAAPVQHAIMRGVEITGVTTIRMDEGMDTGPILLQSEEQVRPQDDARALGDRLAVIGGRLLVQTLDGLGAGSIPDRAQDQASATFAPKLKPEDRIIDWSRSAEEILRQVRALAPEPAAATTYRGRNLKILRASQGTAPASRPGRLALTEGWPAVTAGDGVPVVLEEVQLEGGRRMPGAAFARGHPPGIDERLGAPPGGSGAQG